MTELRKLLTKRRKELGHTQKAVANHLGWGTSQLVSNFERGLCPFPKDKLKSVAKFLRIDKQRMLHAIMCDHEKDIWKWL